MRLSLSAALLIASIPTAIAQATIFTTTLPWADGNTIVISESIDALGETAAIVTISTLGATGTTAPVNPLLATTSKSSINPLLATGTITTVPANPTTTNKKTTTQYQGPVADTPSACTGDLCPSTTSYYWFTSNGVVYSTYFSPTFATGTEVTAVPAGTVLDYSSYAASNGAAITAAAASQASQKAITSGSAGHREISVGGFGWNWIVVLGGIIGGGALLI